MAGLRSGLGSSITDKHDVEFHCKFCDRKYKSSSAFMSHLGSAHVSVEGGSYICRYGENGICSACPGVGVSKGDYTAHIGRHHINRDKVVFHPNSDLWSVLSSSVNLPAVLNNPAKGKQRDFFTRSWGAEFVDTALLPPCSHVCEIPPNTFDKYLRRVRKHYVRHKPGPGSAAGTQSGQSSAASSRETTPSPVGVPAPARAAPARQLDIPAVFLDPSFDLTNPATFSQVFSGVTESLGSRANPFQIETAEARQVESSGRLVQERLQHYIDQVEVSIASQVCTKSHHFFQVMTYHDALMSQLLSLLSCAATVRGRLHSVQGGVVEALKVSRLAVRRHNLTRVLTLLGTVETLHRTRPTIHTQLARQEYSSALELIATSRDILAWETAGLDCLAPLPAHLAELTQQIQILLLEEFQTVVAGELGREVAPTRTADLPDQQQQQEEVTGYDEAALAAVVGGLVRQDSQQLCLEFLEQQAVAAVKSTIKTAVLSVLDITTEVTLTSLVGEFAGQATPEGWCELLDLLLGSCLALLDRVARLHRLVVGELPSPDQANIVMLNVCEQTQERLGKLVSLRVRTGLALVTARELELCSGLVGRLVERCDQLVGPEQHSSSSLALALHTATIVFVQHRQEALRGQLVQQMEGESWRMAGTVAEELSSLHPVLQPGLGVEQEGNSPVLVRSVLVLLSSISEYCGLAELLPQATTEIGLKTTELLKLFNSRTCQLVLGAGAVSVAGLKTITVRHLAVTRSSLELVTRVIPGTRKHLASLHNTAAANSEKQSSALARNFDNTAKDYSEHLTELDKKMVQVMDAALNQQLSGWTRKPPVPSESFRGIGKQLSKFHEAVQDVLPAGKVRELFLVIHSQFLGRVRARLKEAGLTRDGSPAHGLVSSELHFYKENLRYLAVLPEERLAAEHLETVWSTA